MSPQGALQTPGIPRRDAADVPLFVAAVVVVERSRSDRVLAGIIERCCADDMPGSKLMSNA
jgi:hypothetical protein